MSALFDAVIQSTPTMVWETLADKVVAQEFIDPEFACAAFSASSYVTAQGAKMIHPEMGSAPAEIGEEAARIRSAAARILEHDGQVVEMNGLLTNLLLQQALFVVLKRLKTIDWSKYITDLFSEQAQ